MTFKELRTQYETNGLLFSDQFPPLQLYNSMAYKEDIGTVEFDHDDWMGESSGHQNKSYFDRRPHQFHATLLLCQPTEQTVVSLNNPIYETDAAISSLSLYDAVKQLAVFFKPAEGEKQKMETTQREFVRQQGILLFEEFKARHNKLGEKSKYQGEQFVNFILDKEPPLIESQLDDWLNWDETHRPIQFKRKLLEGATAPTLDNVRKLYNSDTHEQTWFYSWVQPQILNELYYETAETVLSSILMFKEWLVQTELEKNKDSVAGKNNERTQNANAARSKKKGERETSVRARYLSLINDGMADDVALNKLIKEFPDLGRQEQSRRTMIARIIKPLR